MSGFVRWSEIRDDHVARAGGEDAVRAAAERLLAEAASDDVPDEAGDRPTER
jgi:hypothetical protein